MNPPWSDAILDDLARDYPADAHEDVADLIAGVRRVLALHAPWQPIVAGITPDCSECGDERPVLYPCATVRALNCDD